MTDQAPTTPDTVVVPVDCPFDTYLPRTPYLVIPKMALQAMPIQWRQRMVALLDEADDAGLETPSYLVYRDDPEYVLVERSDSEDEYSPIIEVSPIRSDPWADYRHANAGDVKALSPRFNPLAARPAAPALSAKGGS